MGDGWMGLLLSQFFTLEGNPSTYPPITHLPSKKTILSN